MIIRFQRSSADPQTEVSIPLNLLCRLVPSQKGPQVLQLGHLAPERSDIDVVPVLVKELPSARRLGGRGLGDELTLDESRTIGTISLTKRAKTP
jgi:hypothetical protein